MIDTTKMPGWNFDELRCPCDLHFVQWLQARSPLQRVLHLGTGLHHKVGTSGIGSVIGITISPEEHASYIELVQNRPELTENYCVLFGDLYAMPLDLLGTFDVVSLFHLGEYHARDYADSSVEISLLCNLTPHIASGGYLVLYTRSAAYNWVKEHVASWLDKDRFEDAGTYQTLQLYRKL